MLNFTKIIFGYLFYISSIYSLDVLSPSNFSGHITSMIFNKFIGSQNTTLNITNTSIAVWSGSKTPQSLSTELCTEYQNKILFVYLDNQLNTLLEEKRISQFFGKCNPLAIIRPQRDPFKSSQFLGIRFNLKEEDCCEFSENDIKIPILTVWEHDVSNIISFVSNQNGSVLVSLIKADEQIWDSKLFDQTLFIFGFRILLPILNAIILIFGINAFRLQFKSFLNFKNKRSSLAKEMIPFLLTGIIFEIISCIIRTIYCSITPILSNSILTLSQSMGLINISLPLQMFVLMIASHLCRKLTTSTIRSKEKQEFIAKIWIRIMNFICIFIFGFEMYTIYDRSNSNNIFNSLIMSCVFSLIAIFVSGIVYIYCGVGFLKRVKNSEKLARKDSTMKDFQAKYEMRKAFSRRIFLSVAFLIIELILLLTILITPNNFFTPNGFGIILFIYFLAFTLSSGLQITAFTPKKSKLRRKSLAAPKRSIKTKTNNNNNNNESSGDQQETEPQQMDQDELDDPIWGLDLSVFDEERKYAAEKRKNRLEEATLFKNSNIDDIHKQLHALQLEIQQSEKISTSSDKIEKVDKVDNNNLLSNGLLIASSPSEKKKSTESNEEFEHALNQQKHEINQLSANKQNTHSHTHSHSHSHTQPHQIHNNNNNNNNNNNSENEKKRTSFHSTDISIISNEENELKNNEVLVNQNESLNLNRTNEENVMLLAPPSNIVSGRSSHKFKHSGSFPPYSRVTLSESNSVQPTTSIPRKSFS